MVHWNVQLGRGLWVAEPAFSPAALCAQPLCYPGRVFEVEECGLQANAVTQTRWVGGRSDLLRGRRDLSRTKATHLQTAAVHDDV